jgi:hypothetical protein
MDQEKELQEIGEIEEIKHMLIEFMKTQETILERLEQIARDVDRLKHQTAKEKKRSKTP